VSTEVEIPGETDRGKEVCSAWLSRSIILRWLGRAKSSRPCGFTTLSRPCENAVSLERDMTSVGSRTSTGRVAVDERDNSDSLPSTRMLRLTVLKEALTEEMTTTEDLIVV
jgi:hypothetical protein